MQFPWSPWLKAPRIDATRTLTWIGRIHSRTYINTVTTMRCEAPAQLFGVETKFIYFEDTYLCSKVQNIDKTYIMLIFWGYLNPHYTSATCTHHEDTPVQHSVSHTYSISHPHSFVHIQHLIQIHSLAHKQYESHMQYTHIVVRIRTHTHTQQLNNIISPTFNVHTKKHTINCKDFSTCNLTFLLRDIHITFTTSTFWREPSGISRECTCNL